MNVTKESTSRIEDPPSADPIDPARRSHLITALTGKGSDYEPRTHHLLDDGTPRFVNRLIEETSPYLLQHAHNPVNWFPWGDEAFETARRLGRPVLLSIGYSTCHWCHVMEAESFEDLGIARFLNQNYVAIKVDREERPDVDAIYMSAVQMLTGHGGWPMTVWLTADRAPFYGGTYYPARDGDRGAPMGFLSMLMRLRQVFDREPQRIAKSAKEITDAIRGQFAARAESDIPGPSALRDAIEEFAADYDPREGGIDGAPKFPSSLPIRLLLRYHRRTGDRRCLDMASNTLTKMAAGGIYDHVAGGFHRYSTDHHWLVPHFEKMLYDNALLVRAYLDGFLVTGDADFARVARETLDYVLREMTSPEGMFYSATDADSLGPDGHMDEGYYFTWTSNEIRVALGDADAALVLDHYNVRDRGNFEGRSILHTPMPLAVVAARHRLDVEEARGQIDGARDILRRRREERPKPLCDTKIQTSWNALMISALAHGARVLGDSRYAEAARRAAHELLASVLVDGRLRHTFKDGVAQHAGYLDDYAFLIGALLDIFEMDFDPKDLASAKRLQGTLDAHFADGSGGYFMTADDHEELLARQKPMYDGAEPCGNSVAALNLLRLAAYTGDDAYRVRADACLRAFGQVLTKHPRAMAEMFCALDLCTDRAAEVVVVRAEGDGEDPLVERLRRVYLPNAAMIVMRDEAHQRALAGASPLAANKVRIGGRSTAYVCERGMCLAPTTDPEGFEQQLREAKPYPS
ncbi:MAG: thioredoxin domain-containing protein [Deltaproteobacteria bacterium]|nr:thioredoxin domain-containing protein [Deltaproteobacteria bacterium]